MGVNLAEKVSPAGPHSKIWGQELNIFGWGKGEERGGQGGMGREKLVVGNSEDEPRFTPVIGRNESGELREGMMRQTGKS